MFRLTSPNMNCQPQFASDFQKEYEVQLYGFVVNDIFLYFRNSLEDHFNQLVEELQKTLLDRKWSNVEDISVVREGLIKLWKGASSAFYEKLKEAVKQYFEIPSHVLLPEDKVHILSYHAEEEKEIDKNLKELTNKLASVRMMKQHLEQENLSLKKSQALEKQLSPAYAFSYRAGKWRLPDDDRTQQLTGQLIKSLQFGGQLSSTELNVLLQRWKNPKEGLLPCIVKQILVS